MHATDLIWMHTGPLVPDDAPVERGTCCVTGQEDALTIPRKLLITSSWTSHDLLRAPGSDRVSISAFCALRHPWERKSSWITTASEFRRLDRVGVRAAALGDAPIEPWAAYATTSYKKHGALMAPVNMGNRRVWLFESRLVDMSDRSRVADWWERITAIQRVGFGRTIIESLHCPPGLMRKYGLGPWLAYERWARLHRTSPLYEFLCYLLPSLEELKGMHDQQDSSAGAPDLEQPRLL